jgi:hypothetical protein
VSNEKILGICPVIDLLPRDYPGSDCHDALSFYYLSQSAWSDSALTCGWYKGCPMS